MKQVSIIATLVLAFIGLGLAGVAVHMRQSNKEMSESGSFQLQHNLANQDSQAKSRISIIRSFGELGLPIRRVTIVDDRFSLAVADNESARVSGLSNVAQMGFYDGMLFVFETDAIHGFWMKDMRFSLDIIWLDAAGQVVHIEERLSPETYPKVFRPDLPARYVIELNAGVVSELGIRVGSQINLYAQELSLPGVGY